MDQIEENSSPKKQNVALPKLKTWILVLIGVVSLLVVTGSLAGIVLLSTLGNRNLAPFKSHAINYGMMIDAGSSKSELKLFQWYGMSKDSLPELKLVGSVAKQPGIHSFITHLEDLPAYLSSLLESAKGMIPKDKWSSSPIFLRATGGMRLLNLTDQERILNLVQDDFGRSPFLFENSWASVISGSYEALYAWVASNYQMGKFDSAISHNTFGVMDMGGASTQLAFLADSSLLQGEGATFHVKITVHNKKYALYARSWPGYGLDEFRKRFNQALIDKANLDHPLIQQVSSSCMNRGYSESISYNGTKYEFYGVGNRENCGIDVLSEMNTGDNAFGEVKFTGSYGPFMGISGFQYSALFFMNAQKGFSLIDFADKVTAYCNLTWDQVKSLYPNVSETYLATYCFSGTYLFSLLSGKYGLNTSETDLITFANLNWASGAMIHEADYLNVLELDSKTYLQTGPGIILMLLSCLMLFISLSMILLVALVHFFPKIMDLRIPRTLGWWFLTGPNPSTTKIPSVSIVTTDAEAHSSAKY